jgi:hypothetical protein
MRRIGSFLLHEGKKAVPPTLFYLAIFHLSAIIRHLDATSLGITPMASGTATISALILGKLYIVMDERPFANRFAKRPLIFGTLWKTLIYSLLATLATFLEELIPLLFREPHLEEALATLHREVSFPRFLANHLILVVSIFVFSALSELSRAMGSRKVWELFFGKRFLRE